MRNNRRKIWKRVKEGSADSENRMDERRAGRTAAGERGERGADVRLTFSCLRLLSPRKPEPDHDWPGT